MPFHRQEKHLPLKNFIYLFFFYKGYPHLGWKYIWLSTKYSFYHTKDTQNTKKIEPPSAHISGCNNSQKRVELSALTQDIKQQSATAEGNWPSLVAAVREANVAFS
jgi:hypothetical protein